MYLTFFHTLLFGPLCLGYISKLVDTVVGYFCITFLYFLYSFFCNLQCTLFVTNPANWLPHHTHTHPFNGPFPGLPGWASTRKVKPIWILLKQETVSGSGISWAICSLRLAPDITTPTTHCPSFFTGRMPFLPPNQQRQSTEGMAAIPIKSLSMLHTA